MAEYICPHCKNPIYDDEALLCMYCGESLNRGGRHNGVWKVLFIAVVLLLLISFILAQHFFRSP